MPLTGSREKLTPIAERSGRRSSECDHVHESVTLEDCCRCKLDKSTLVGSQRLNSMIYVVERMLSDDHLCSGVIATKLRRRFLV